MQLHLTLRPGERRGARERGLVAVFVDAIEKRFARGCSDHPKGDTNRRARRNAYASADGEDRIQYGADGNGERTAIRDRDRHPNIMAATEESRPVRLELRRTNRF